MAIYHLSVQPLSRSKGRSSVAAVAYRAGVKLTDDRTGLVHDYTKKRGVVAAACFMFDGDKKITLDRGELWNKAELAEKRKDARTLREIEVNLPHEMTDEQRQKLVESFCKRIAQQYGVAVDYAIHRPNKHGDQRNEHAHISITTRGVTLDNDNKIVLGDKTLFELSNTKLKKMNELTTSEQIDDIREWWSEMTNNDLAAAGINARIDHRSNADRGLDTLPTKKVGWYHNKLERNGIETEKNKYNIEVKLVNEQIVKLKKDAIVIDSKIKLQQKRNSQPKPKPNAASINSNVNNNDGVIGQSFREKLKQQQQQRQQQQQQRQLEQERQLQQARKLEQEQRQEKGGIGVEHEQQAPSPSRERDSYNSPSPF